MQTALQNPRLDPARSIVERLGGEIKVSRITRSSLSTPYSWQYPKEKGGTGGNIPQRHHRTLLDYARENRIPLKAEDFLPSKVAN